MASVKLMICDVCRTEAKDYGRFTTIPEWTINASGGRGNADVCGDCVYHIRAALVSLANKRREERERK